MKRLTYIVTHALDWSLTVGAATITAIVTRRVGEVLANKVENKLKK